MKIKPKKNVWTVAKAEAGMSLQEFIAARMNASKRVAKQHIDAKDTP